VLIHVVDISHKNFEDQINVVKQTLQDIGAGDKPTILVFNKTDAFTYTHKEEDDLSPSTRENLSLNEIRRTWMKGISETAVLFISAQKKENIDEFKGTAYTIIKDLHLKRYPYNHLLY
jgi:GTP-binding protein HflX